ncbi:3,4-dihydroxy-2-butanone 4-phosphate synthase [Prauserella sediminis]|uniref:3,4-dihydroxy-2-butanone-4-phosphate synthase n=1 Tax=Prauserella sediminis TaxID=577680 RepID=A0A839XWP6_9PSEU|nr:3,4-dihydroxy-2-butanone-4-phosphate synthase [Prauserella sediminis]MBB3665488.1 3,4-dihydroxy-2-butanone 4-phosphate synthase [Prauserella sediminis]
MSCDTGIPLVVATAAAELVAGKPVVLLDDLNPPYRSELVFAAEHADATLVAEVVRYSSGFLTVALTDADADRLGLPSMWPWSAGPTQPGFTITADAAEGITTGISAADRARTIRIMGASDGVADQLRRPGHVVGVRTTASGTHEALGVSEAAVELLRLAGARPAAGMATLLGDQGELLSPGESRDLASDAELALVTVADIACPTG